MPDDTPKPPLCPSAQPGMEGLVVFGVRDETAAHGHGQGPRVGYLAEALPVTEDVLARPNPSAKSPTQPPPSSVPWGHVPCTTHTTDPMRRVWTPWRRHREAQADAPNLLFVPDEDAWPKLESLKLR
jgi:hypothetical protein